MKNTVKKIIATSVSMTAVLFCVLITTQAYSAQDPPKKPTPTPMPVKSNAPATFDFDKLGKVFARQEQSQTASKNFGDEAAIYAEIKAAIEKYEEKISPGHKETPEEARESLAGMANILGELAGNAKSEPAVNKTAKMFDELLVKCDQLVRTDPKRADYYLLRGKARYFRIFADAARYVRSEAEMLTSPTALALIPQASIDLAFKDLSDSLTINPAVKLKDSDAADAHRFHGKLFVISAAKKYSNWGLYFALEDFTIAKKLDGWNPVPQGFLKGIYLISKDGDLVGNNFAKQLKENPSDASSIYSDRAGYYCELVEYQKVVADLMRYTNSIKDYDFLNERIVGTIYATLNQSSTAAGLIFLDENSTGEQYLERASARTQIPELVDNAFKDATEALKRNPSLTSAHLIRAKILVEKRNPDEGIAEANVALAQDANNVGALSIRAVGYAVKGDYSHSLDDLNRATALDPELASLYNAFGVRNQIYTALGKPDLAAADLKKAQQLANIVAHIQQMK